jgi:hypothetical protein
VPDKERYDMEDGALESMSLVLKGELISFGFGLTVLLPLLVA